MKKILNRFSIYMLLFVLINLVGCAGKKTVPEPAVRKRPPLRETTVPPQARKILARVKKLAVKASLNSLGQLTMKESVEIMKMGPSVSVLLIKEYKLGKNWKYRYWIVDILGYIKDKANITPIIRIIENPKENMSIRLRACDSIKEMNYSSSARQLMGALKRVKNSKLKSKIENTIESLR